MTGCDDKLFFDAVQYVLEDMPPEARQAFEGRLADEQAAREAVAEAVALCQLAKELLHEVPQRRANRRPAEFIALASNNAICDVGGVSLAVQSASHADHAWRRPAAWVSMAVAAGIMAAVVMSGLGRDPNLAPAPHADKNDGRFANSVADGGQFLDGGGQLAVAWLGSASISDPADEAMSDAAREEIVGESDDAQGTALIEASGGFPASEGDWVFEAVTAAPAGPAASSTALPQEG